MTVVAAVMVAGCGGGGVALNPGSGGGGGGGGAGTVDPLVGPGPISGPPVASATRYAAMDKVDKKLDDLMKASVPPIQREQQVKAYMATLPEFIKTGISPDGTLWGQFADKSYYMVSDRAVPDDFTAKGPSRDRLAQAFMNVPAPPSQPSAGGALEVVSGSKAYVFDTFDGSMGTPNEEITEMLTKRGYNVSSGPATVEALRNVKDAGVFYISTHGGQATHPLNGGRAFWSMWTATEATPENDLKYEADLRAGRLVVFKAEYGKSIGPFTYSERRYAITADWITYYGWTFADRSVAFINCCWSDAGGFNQALRMLAKPASTTLGWSNAAHPDKAWRVARYFFDRSLGTNLSAPILPGGTRPFSTDEVFAKEQQLNYTDGTTTIYGPCVLVKQGKNAMLAPAISTMEVYERGIEPTTVQSQLFVKGQLGKTLPRSLKIGGVAASAITMLNENEWQVTIPSAAGAGFSGQVEIEMQSGIKSNTPLLTSWTGTFTYEGAPLTTVGNNVRGKITSTLHFRADLHKYREVVDGPLVTPPARYARAAVGSSANWSLTGALPGWSYVTPTAGTLPYGLRQQPVPFGTGYVADLVLNRRNNTVGYAWGFLGTNVSYRVQGVPQTFDVVTPQDHLLIATPNQTPDRVGGPTFTPKAVGNLLPDMRTALQVFQGATPERGTKLTVSALSVQHAPNDDWEEDPS